MDHQPDSFITVLEVQCHVLSTLTEFSIVKQMKRSGVYFTCFLSGLVISLTYYCSRGPVRAMRYYLDCLQSSQPSQEWVEGLRSQPSSPTGHSVDSPKHSIYCETQ